MILSLRVPLLAAGFAAALALSTAGLAADQPAPPAMPPGPTTDLTKIAKGTYKVEPGHTTVFFKLSHLGFSTFMGRINKIDGDLGFNNKHPEKSKLNITIDLTSVDTKVAKLDEHLKSPDFFDTAKFPQATFKSTKIEKLTDTTGKVTGDLTLHGVTKPVTLDVVFNGAGPHLSSGAFTLGFDATTTIKRTEFGISKYAPMVGDDVTLTIEAEFNQPAPEKKP